MAKQNKNNYIWIGIAVVVLAIVFISNSNNNSQNEVTCNSPYIKVGNSCCLDQNSNGVCDSDEQPAQTQQGKVSLSLSKSKIEKTLNKTSDDWFKEYVQLENTGEKKIEYAILCSPYPNRWNADFSPYNDFAKEIPDHELYTWIDCNREVGDTGYWKGEISPNEVHTLTITYQPWDNDEVGRHESKLVIADVEDDYSIEIPIIVNIIE